MAKYHGASGGKLTVIEEDDLYELAKACLTPDEAAWFTEIHPSNLSPEERVIQFAAAEIYNARISEIRHRVLGKWHTSRVRA